MPSRRTKLGDGLCARAGGVDVLCSSSQLDQGRHGIRGGAEPDWGGWFRQGRQRAAGVDHRDGAVRRARRRPRDPPRPPRTGTTRSEGGGLQRVSLLQGCAALGFAQQGDKRARWGGPATAGGERGEGAGGAGPLCEASGGTGASLPRGAGVTVRGYGGGCDHVCDAGAQDGPERGAAAAVGPSVFRERDAVWVGSARVAAGEEPQVVRAPPHPPQPRLSRECGATEARRGDSALRRA
mmetsp:Transcript_40321/g.92005  ORF Transcript_40321/g.92005 Transcript_40321/m.92005 type:complete len:238 (+) Transcript_40321:94-807(+)